MYQVVYLERLSCNIISDLLWLIQARIYPNYKFFEDILFAYSTPKEPGEAVDIVFEIHRELNLNMDNNAENFDVSNT